MNNSATMDVYALMSITSATETVDPHELVQQILDPANRANQYQIYERVRATQPLQLPGTGLTVFSRYEDCAEALRHPSASSDQRLSAAALRIVEREPADTRRTPAFLFLDPPDHTRLRRLVSKAFAPRVVTKLEPFITELVDSLLDRIAQTGRFDVVSDLAYPVPITVICKLLGVPMEDEPQFRHAAAMTAQGLDPFVAATGSEPHVLLDLQQAGLWLREYLVDLAADRRENPCDDLISRLIVAEESGDQLTENEIIATCNLLLVAGHETTVGLIANAILAMLRDPQQWVALSTDSLRASAVIEETLRYDSPLQYTPRVAADDLTIGHTRVIKGADILLLLAAANRDASAFERADEFDPDRKPIRHLSFGQGPHFCLGAPLARLEARVTLAALTKRFPYAQLDSEPLYKPNFTMRGLSSLLVQV